jgi:hypothetical protein
MNDGAVAYVRTFGKQHSDAGKHMYRTIFLHVAAVFDDNTAPVAAQGRSRTNVNVLANDDIACDYRLWMHERRRMYYRNKTFESVKHRADRGLFYFLR